MGPMGCLVWSLAKKPSRTFGRGRHCRECGDPLSVYNPGSVCSRHSDKERFNIHAFIDETRWPPYLPNPDEHPWDYTEDELLVLVVLSRNNDCWVHLNLVFLEYGRQQINNSVRKLRRKGFTIEGRPQGGYRLRDRVPVVSGKGVARHVGIS